MSIWRAPLTPARGWKAFQEWLGPSSNQILSTLAILLASALVYEYLRRHRRKVEIGKRKKEADERRLKGGSGAAADEDIDGGEEVERAPPTVEAYPWKEAHTLNGCPWDFSGCEDIPEALSVVWRQPLDPQLQGAADELSSSTKELRVARCTFPSSVLQKGCAEDEQVFLLVYTLKDGATIYGGPPVDSAVALQASLDSEGLRHRKSARRWLPFLSQANPESLLPAVAPFYRIHDGVGVVLSIKDLPGLLADPKGSYGAGSCFYIYPRDTLEPLTRYPNLVAFGRVDKSCVACADIKSSDPAVVYVESQGAQPQEDEEPLLVFVSDTIQALAGKSMYYGY